jgi:hypothetical protein
LISLTYNAFILSLWTYLHSFFTFFLPVLSVIVLCLSLACSLLVSSILYCKSVDPWLVHFWSQLLWTLLYFSDLCASYQSLIHSDGSVKSKFHQWGNVSLNLPSLLDNMFFQSMEFWSDVSPRFSHFYHPLQCFHCFINFNFTWVRKLTTCKIRIPDSQSILAIISDYIYLFIWVLESLYIFHLSHLIWYFLHNVVALSIKVMVITPSLRKSSPR